MLVKRDGVLVRWTIKKNTKDGGFDYRVETRRFGSAGWIAGTKRDVQRSVDEAAQRLVAKEQAA
jgi:hypothetical protein